MDEWTMDDYLCFALTEHIHNRRLALKAKCFGNLAIAHTLFSHSASLYGLHLALVVILRTLLKACKGYAFARSLVYMVFIYRFPKIFMGCFSFSLMNILDINK